MRKILFKTTACGMITFMLALSVHAQQLRVITNNPFVHLQRPASDPPVANSNNFTFPTHARYRTLNGTNNNIGNGKTAFGSANIALWREIPAEYGSSDPRNALGGTNRPSPRLISNVVIDEPVTHFSERELSAFVYVWGQFIDHDMTLTPTATTEYVPIGLPPGETVFTEQIPFYRSEVRENSGITNTRQQSNLNTAWIDGSVVYGCETARANWLRTFRDGKMKTSAGNFLPWNTLTGEQADPIDPNAPSMANDNGHTVKTFAAGDVRAAEHPGILSLHTLFVREHNRICNKLIAQGYRNDEQIYQMARKEVGALIQAITYQEFLPAIGISLRSYRGYNSSVRPDINNTFATASYRVGHTMVADDIMMLDNNCNGVGTISLDLVDAFWMPQLVLDYTPDPFLKGLAAHKQYETDTRINSVLRNMLFGSPNDPVRFGIDLGSLNIQRGRDHGLPNYNTARRFYTGRSITSFAEITTVDSLSIALKNLYGSVNNIDLWVGLLAEDHLPGKSVGKTMHEMLRVQFESIRDGDYYYYLYDPALPYSTKFQLLGTRMSDVLKRNTSLTNLQRNVFFVQECPDFPSEDDRSIVSKGNIMTEEIGDAVKIFPNPATNVLNIQVAQPVGNYNIKVYSVNSVLMKTLSTNGQNVKLDISNFARGVYFINIINSKETKTIRFVKL